MIRPFANVVCAFALVAAPAFAQEKQTSGQVAGDIASTPVQDLNLKSKSIPDVLVQATDDPYAARGLRTCTAINKAVGDLTAVLGPDYDSPEEGNRKISGARVAKGVVQGLIPFRGAIREVSGAAGSQRRYDTAVDAGIARRGFLRGIARSRGCKITG